MASKKWVRGFRRQRQAESGDKPQHLEEPRYISGVKMSKAAGGFLTGSTLSIVDTSKL